MRLLPIIDLVGTPLLTAWAAGLELAELLRPVRARAQRRRARLPSNLLFGSLSGLIVRAGVLPALTRAARQAERHEFGLVRWLLPKGPGRAVAAFLGLDLGIYVWHRLNHRVAWLWRFHSVHHADLDLDLSTGVRLHPGELLLSLPLRAAQVVLLGASVRTLLAYELTMQLATLFHHTNLDLGASRDRALATCFMTPRLHGRPHSATPAERDSNWGVVLSVWDHCFGSFDARPARDPRLGLATLRYPEELEPGALLRLPFRDAESRARAQLGDDAATGRRRRPGHGKPYA